MRLRVSIDVWADVSPTDPSRWETDTQGLAEALAQDPDVSRCRVVVVPKGRERIVADVRG